MSFPVPVTVQTSLLFDDAMIIDLHAFAECFQRDQRAQDVHFELVEASPEHTFVRLSGSNDLMITIEQTMEPLKPEPFLGVLHSSYMQLVSPKAEEKIDRHRSGTLICVSQGIMSDESKTDAVPDEVGTQRKGQSQDEFLLRLNTLCALTRDYCTIRKPVMVHWTQSNQLFDYPTFTKLSGEPQPSLINIHPQLYSDRTDAQGQWVGFTTFVAAHFLGWEITFRSAPVAWGKLYEYALTFLKVCSSKEGYVVPHGDTFGDGEGLSIAVRHIPEGPKGPAVYELTLIQSVKLGYECPADLLPVPGGGADDTLPDLNPDDPVDRAILQRLAKREDTVSQKRRATVPEDVSEAETLIARSGGGFGRRQSPPAP